MFWYIFACLYFKKKSQIRIEAAIAFVCNNCKGQRITLIWYPDKMQTDKMQKNNKMQICQNANPTYCKYNKMQIRRNANETKCKPDKMQIRQNANET